MKMSDRVKSSAEMWDNRFAGEKFAYGKEPNVWLAERISEISPPVNNKALIPADGEGRNAVWCARLGWNTEVFDLSAQGKIKCEMLAAEHGVSVDYNVSDLRNLQLSGEHFDLIAFSWFHTPSELRKEKFPMFMTALKKGGHLIIEGYHKTQMPLDSGGPKSMDLLWDLDEVLEEFLDSLPGEVKIEHAAVTSTILDESDLHTGLARVVRLHLRRI